jgi:hypothetical protein
MLTTAEHKRIGKTLEKNMPKMAEMWALLLMSIKEAATLLSRSVLFMRENQPPQTLAFIRYGKTFRHLMPNK